MGKGGKRGETKRCSSRRKCLLSSLERQGWRKNNSRNWVIVNTTAIMCFCQMFKKYLLGDEWAGNYKKLKNIYNVWSHDKETLEENNYEPLGHNVKWQLVLAELLWLWTYLPVQIMSPNILPDLVAQTVKNLPAIQETRVRSLGHEDPLENGMATHSSILSWKIPWTEEPGRLLSMGSQRVGHDWVTNTFIFSL